MPISRDHMRRAFGAIIRRCLAHPVAIESRSVIFPDPGDVMYSGKTQQVDHIFVVLLSGKQQTRHWEDGHLTHTTFTTEHVYFMDADCPTLFLWQHRCQRFGIAINPTRVAISWNNHRPPNDAKIPDLLYQSHQIMPRELMLLFELMAERRSYPPDSQVTGKIARLILEAMDEFLAQPQPVITNPSDHHQQICQYIEDNINQPLDRKTISSFFHLHPDYISRLFARHGKGFTQYLEDRRIQHACELLTGSTLPINQIASMCGYANSGYFIKVFRKQNGMSPGSFRKKHASERIGNQAHKKTPPAPPQVSDGV